jgi:hypothetical protein
MRKGNHILNAAASTNLPAPADYLAERIKVEEL